MGVTTSNKELSTETIKCGGSFNIKLYFMKVFKQLEGITPTQYKNSFGRRNIN